MTMFIYFFLQREPWSAAATLLLLGSMLCLCCTVLCRQGASIFLAGNVLQFAAHNALAAMSREAAVRGSRSGYVIPSGDTSQAAAHHANSSIVSRLQSSANLTVMGHCPLA